MMRGATDWFPIHMKADPSKEGTPQVLFAIVTTWEKSQPTGWPLLKFSPNASMLVPDPFTLRIVEPLHGTMVFWAMAWTVHCAWLFWTKTSRHAKLVSRVIFFMRKGQKRNVLMHSYVVNIEVRQLGFSEVRRHVVKNSKTHVVAI